MAWFSNAACRPESIPANFMVEGLDESSFQTLRLLYDIKTDDGDNDVHIISSGMQQDCAPVVQRGLDGRSSIATICSEPSYDTISFENICHEDGTWTDADFPYTVSTNAGTGTTYEFDGADGTSHEADLKSVYDGFVGINLNRWAKATVYYTGTLQPMYRAGAMVTLFAPFQADTPKEEPAKTAPANTADIDAARQRLATLQQQKDAATAANNVPEVRRIGAAIVKIWDTYPSLDPRKAAPAESAGAVTPASSAPTDTPDIPQISLYFKEVSKFFKEHYATEPVGVEDGIAVFLEGLAPVSFDHKALHGAMLAMGQYDDNAKAFGMVIEAAYHFNKAKAALAANNAVIAKAELEACGAQVMELEQQDLFSSLDPRQQSLAREFMQRVMALGAKIDAATCNANEIKGTGGACVPCKPWQVPNEDQSKCVVTEASCATISATPSSADDTNCTCKVETPKWNDTKKTCEPCADGTKWDNGECKAPPKRAGGGKGGTGGKGGSGGKGGAGSATEKPAGDDDWGVTNPYK